MVDTRQTVCYQATGTIACPSQADLYYGQDAQHQGPQPAYRDNEDGTITDTWPPSVASIPIPGPLTEVDTVESDRFIGFLDSVMPASATRC